MSFCEFTNKTKGCRCLSSLSNNQGVKGKLSATHRQLLGQLADHAVQVVGQALELLVGGLEEVRTPSGQQPQGAPAVVGVPHHPAFRQIESHTHRGSWGRISAAPQLLLMNSCFQLLNSLVLVLHHVGGVGLLDGLGKELVQRGHELPGRKSYESYERKN